MRRNWNSKPCPERRKGGDKRNGRRRAGRLPWDVLCLLKKMVGGSGYNRVEG